MKIEISKSWLPWCGEIGLNLFVRWERPWQVVMRLLVVEVSVKGKGLPLLRDEVKTPELVRCGFCGRDQSEVVEAIIVGATSTICFECVEICAGVVAKDREERNKANE